MPNPTEAVQALALKPGSVRHYVEFHIEQGPQLEAAGLALGVVSGIAGQTWLAVSVEGVQNHGGRCCCMECCCYGVLPVAEHGGEPWRPHGSFAMFQAC